MDRIQFFALFLVLFSPQLTAQNISMRDFVIPESRYKTLLGSFQGSYITNRSGDQWNDRISKNGSVEAALSNSIGYNSEDVSYRVASNFVGHYSSYSSTSDNKSYDLRSSQKDRNTQELSDLMLSGQYSAYLMPDKLFIYGSAHGMGSYTLSRNATDTNNVVRFSYSYKNRTIAGSLGGGIGYGKIREASPVFAVVRIIEKLHEDGYLSRELTREEILEIVNVYTRRIEYASKYDRPTKYLLDDIIQKLETFGVLKGTKASAYEVARVAEVFQENIFPRMVGWTIQAGISIDRNQQENITSQIDITRQFRRIDQNAVTVRAEYGYPFSLSLHWYVIGTVSLPVYGKQDRVGQYISSILYYQIGEKISNDVNVSYSRHNQYEYSSAMPEALSSTNDLTIGNTFRYFIENNVSLSVGIRYVDRLSVNDGSPSASRSTNGEVGIIFGVNYRFF